MSWTAPITWAVGQIVGASDLNTQLRDNLNYLFAGRPSGSVLWQQATNYTSTSTIFADVDATHITFSMTISGSRVLVIGYAVLNCSATANEAVYIANYSVDLGALGLSRGSAGNGGTWAVSVSDIFTGLTAGSRSFRLRFAVSNPAATGTVKMLEGSSQRYWASMIGLEV